MSRKKKHLVPEKDVDALIQSAGSVGELERLAGLVPDLATRTAFWFPFANISPASASLEAGIAALKTRIRARCRNRKHRHADRPDADGTALVAPSHHMAAPT